jgi:hypothetical protein
MVAELAHNQDVEGSSPSPATMVDSWKFGVTVTYKGGGYTTRWFPDKDSRKAWIRKEKLEQVVIHVSEKKR